MPEERPVVCHCGYSVAEADGDKLLAHMTVYWDQQDYTHYLDTFVGEQVEITDQQRKQISAAQAELDALNARFQRDLLLGESQPMINQLTADFEDLSTFTDGLMAKWEALRVKVEAVHSASPLGAPHAFEAMHAAPYNCVVCDQHVSVHRAVESMLAVIPLEST